MNAIQLGHREFDLMFEQVYGSYYKENYEIFSELFKNFEIYHEKGELDLEVVLNNFFEKLFIRLFKLLAKTLDPNFQFQPDYINCISQNMRSIEPFGDVPKNLLITMKRQLGATRTFTQGLIAGSYVIKQLNMVNLFCLFNIFITL